MAKRPKPSRVIILLSVIFCLLPFMAGCPSTSTPASRVAEVKAVVDKATTLNQAVDSSITELQGVAQASQLLLLDQNVPADMKPAISQALATASTKLTALRVQKAKIDASLLQWQAILNQTAAEGNNVDLTKEIQTYAAMTSASASYLPPPYNGYVYLGSALAALLAGLIASVIKNLKQGGQINDHKAILTDLVTSVDTLLDPTQNKGIIAPPQIEQAKQVLSGAQAGVTQDAVDAIHDPMQNTAPAN